MKAGTKTLLALGVVLAVEIATSAALHRGDEEWNELALTGSTERRFAALNVLASRVSAADEARARVTELLASEDPALRELAFSTMLARHASLEELYASLQQLEGTEAYAACEFWLTYLPNRERGIGHLSKTRDRSNERGQRRAWIELEPMREYLDATGGGRSLLRAR